MNTIDVTAPAEQTEGTRSQLLRWLCAVGEPVVENQPLVEIETDKVTVEVAAPGSGVLTEMLRHPQDELAPGELLGRITVGAGAVGSPRVAAAGAAAGAVSGSTSASATAINAGVSGASAPAATAGAAHSRPGPIPVSPAVQRLLDQHGIQAASVRGSGPAGQITIDDVLRAAGARVGVAAGVAGASATTVAATPASGAAVSPARDPAAAGEVAAVRAGIRSVPHTPVRRRIAQHMVESLLHTAPHVTTVFEADLTQVLADRERQRKTFEHARVPLTLTAYFVRAAVAAIRAVPQANSQWTDTALEIHEDIHIGIGTAVEDVGLMVPVLRNAGTLDLMGIARGLADLTQRARAGGLTPADMRGGTFTLSNHGVSGSLLAAPIIINQPQAAILGIGKLERRAVVMGEGGEERIVARPRCYVTLTLDHRVMDGHQANHFMRVFTGELGGPR
ncbi:MAG: 2-oxo acid dehydrogenase subunit E2 [Proteobacteria bacterium]|nr:2-oxo acid dehydrogenase subunit E2 [Pseudomonadota bacterium]